VASPTAFCQPRGARGTHEQAVPSAGRVDVATRQIGIGGPWHDGGESVHALTQADSQHRVLGRLCRPASGGWRREVIACPVCTTSVQLAEKMDLGGARHRLRQGFRSGGIAHEARGIADQPSSPAV